MSTPDPPDSPTPDPAATPTPDAPATPTPDRVADTREGDILLWASWAGTAVLAMACVAAVAAPGLESLLVGVSLLLFVLGALVFARALVFAASTRREDLIGIGGLFFLSRSAPRRVQTNLLGSLGAEVLISLVAAASRPYSAMAFAVLAPIYGLGLSGLWGAMHGAFPPRASPGSRP